MKIKVCIKCNKELPETKDYFYFRNDSNKFNNKCIECYKKYRKKYVKENPEKIKNSLDQWYEKNKKKQQEYSRQYYLQNRKSILENKKEYHIENRDHILKYLKGYRKENCDILKKKHKENYDKKKEYYREEKREHYRKNSLYNSYEKQLKNINDIRRDPDNLELLQVKCTYCGKWMNPTNQQTSTRVYCINNNKVGESNFYCSEECKIYCPTYGKIEIPKDHKRIRLEDGSTKIVPKSSKERDYKIEVNPQFRKYIFELDNYECQRCGKTTSLQCHHINPRKTHPHEECDPDNGITLCKKCHKLIHSKPGCRYIDLAKICS